MVILLWLVALLVLKNCNKRGFYLPLFVSFLFSNKIDENHKAFKDPLHVPVGGKEKREPILGFPLKIFCGKMSC